MGPPRPPSLHAGNARWSCWRGSTRSEGPPNYHEVKLGRVPANRCPASFLRIIGSSPFTFKWRARHLKVIREKCSEALHILDRFHIVAKMNKALDEVRAGESRRMALEGRTPVLKKSRWLLLKREANLKTEQRFRLRDLLRYNLKTVRAYLLKEAFQQLWDYNSPAWAGKFLDEWCRQVMRSRIGPMKKIARSLREHRELILNYFRAQKLLSSGVVEGLNNKAKVTMRKSY